MWAYSLPAFLAAEIIGFFLYGAPQDADSVASWIPMFGAFLLFLSYFFSTLAWGRLISKATRLDAKIYALPLGCAAMCFSAAILGHLRLIGYSYQSLAIFLLALGPILISLQERNQNRAWPSLSYLRFPQWLFLAGFACATLTFASLTFSLDSMADPLWYHLTAARLFSDAGKIYLPPHFPIAFKSGLWEYNFIWGNFVLAGPAGGGLIAGQLFGQWTHFFLGTIGSWLIFRQIAEKLLPDLSAEWILMLASLALFSHELVNVSYLGKNDWGAILFALTGLLLFLENRFSLAGFFWGAAFTSKYTEAFSMLGFLLLIPRDFWNFRGMAKAAAFFLIGSAPIFMRNFIYTGNPLFPTMNQFFHSAQLGPSWDGIAAFSGTGISWSSARISQLKETLAQSPLIYPAILGLLAIPFFASARKHWKIAASGFFPLGIFISFVGQKAEIRLLGPSIFFILLFGVIFLKELIYRAFQRSEKTILLFSILIFVPALSYFLPAMKFWRAPGSSMPPTEWIRTHPGGAASAWMRMNLPSGTKIASGAETRIYYLSAQEVSRIWDDPVVDRKLFQERDIKGLYKVLDEAGIQYLLITNALWDTYFDQARWDLISKSTVRFPQAVPFSTENSRVIDVKKMRKFVDELKI